MDEHAAIAPLRARLGADRAAGRRVALVPTMGSLHRGHLALVAAARAAADIVVMSIFVNPLQFGPGEDFERYPRDLARDRTLAEGAGVDVLFAPPVEEMYRGGRDLRVTMTGAASRWEGAVRPGHFDGVLTVVAKLFNIVAPDVACFGQKDIQQAVVIRRMIAELDFPVTVHVVPTVRDADGLALSSRNIYLDQTARASGAGAAPRPAGGGAALAGRRARRRHAAGRGRRRRSRRPVWCRTILPSWIPIGSRRRHTRLVARSSPPPFASDPPDSSTTSFSGRNPRRCGAAS